MISVRSLPVALRVARKQRALFHALFEKLELLAQCEHFVHHAVIGFGKHLAHVLAGLAHQFRRLARFRLPRRHAEHDLFELRDVLAKSVHFRARGVLVRHGRFKIGYLVLEQRHVGSRYRRRGSRYVGGQIGYHVTERRHFFQNGVAVRRRALSVRSHRFVYLQVGKLLFDALDARFDLVHAALFHGRARVYAAHGGKYLVAHGEELFVVLADAVFYLVQSGVHVRRHELSQNELRSRACRRGRAAPSF